MKSSDALPETITTAELARWLEVDPRTIQRLAQAGFLTRVGHGLFHFQRSVSGYVAYQAALAERDRGHGENCACSFLLEAALDTLRTKPDAQALAELADSIERVLQIRNGVMSGRFRA